MSDAAVEAILAAGGVAENSAQMHVHEEMNHLCITLVGTANADGPNGFVMFCDMPA
jgi:hypothetical protein